MLLHDIPREQIIYPPTLWVLYGNRCRICNVSADFGDQHGAHCAQKFASGDEVAFYCENSCANRSLADHYSLGVRGISRPAARDWWCELCREGRCPVPPNE